MKDRRKMDCTRVKKNLKSRKLLVLDASVEEALLLKATVTMVKKK